MENKIQNRERRLNNFNVILLGFGLFISMIGIIFGTIFKQWFFVFLGICLLISTLIHFNWSSKRFGGIYFKFKKDC